jgi:YVTN family beta-propeller protein
VRKRQLLLATALLAALVLGVVVGAGADGDPPRPDPVASSDAPAAPAVEEAVYAHTHEGTLSEAVAEHPYRIYVPNSEGDTVDVIDPDSAEIVRSFPVGGLPQHVTPSYDLRSLWINSNAGNTVQRIDPETGRTDGEPIPVDAPYNLYFTPDGESAIVVAERLQRLDFRDPETMELQESVDVPCEGVNHMDFSPEGDYLIASCEFADAMIKVDLERRELVDRLELGDGTGMPQDVRLAPDGETFYAADMVADGVHVIDGDDFRRRDFIPTGAGAHGLYPSRDAESLYVSNRDEGSVSVLDFESGRELDRWEIPGGGSPDMGGVSPDGDTLWLTGRYDSEVYAFDTETGEVTAQIPVGAGPHGLAVWPQPGRYSLGHTGNMR